MMTIGHHTQLQLLNLAHHQCPLKIYQVQNNQKQGSHPQWKKPLDQMKSLAPPFHRNPTLEAVFLEVRDHGITCDEGSDTISPKHVRHDSLKVRPQKDKLNLELEPEDSESLYATDGGSPQRSRSPSTDPLNIGKLLINAVQIDTPSTYKQAMRSPLKSKWQETTSDEFNGLTEMGTWILVSPPKNRNVIKCKWVFTVKADGRYKAQVVAKGFTQEHGIDYEETFSPVTRYELIHYLLAHAALEDWEIEAMDVKTVYL